MKDGCIVITLRGVIPENITLDELREYAERHIDAFSSYYKEEIEEEYEITAEITLKLL